MKKILNPILPGFNPDPSIIRVNENYYTATSTFEWFPGVQIHHSKDLVHWRLLTRPLDRTSQLKMAGNPPSGGIWAPCLSYFEGIFYLVYTDVKNLDGIFKDTHNYLVTSKNIKGPWSEPVYLNSSGFDPSLFHDDTGKKWLVNQLWDHRLRKENFFGGILLQEYSEKEKKLTGPVKNIFKGTELGCTEGPHLYKKNGYYYLLTAEGGTGFNHAVTIARSKSIEGPYETDPANPILTSSRNKKNRLQKAGHGDIVETRNGGWYLVHLCSRSTVTGYSNLGRETAIQEVHWTADNWLRLAGGGNEPQEEVENPGLGPFPFPAEPALDDFEDTGLSIHFQTLRIPFTEDLFSLTERPGHLRIRGAESLTSNHRVAIVARRQQAFTCMASTCVDFSPESFQQMAGLAYFYNSKKFHYFFVTNNEERGKVLDIISNEDMRFSFPLEEEICINGWENCFLKIEIKKETLAFYYSKDNKNWRQAGPELDANILSDEFGSGLNFTGPFIGLTCQDLTGRKKHADFDFFEYREI